MMFDAVNTRVWPVVPEWTNNITETLEWSTDILRASATGVSQHRGLRIAPARSFAFEALAHGQARRVAEMLLAGWSGAWALPIWPDGQWLTSTLSFGSMSIACNTLGCDFVAGGNALLYDNVTSWEVVTIDTVASDGLTLRAPTATVHWPGSRIYPLRRAIVRDGGTETQGTADLGRRSITFDIAEPCDFPSLASPTVYLGHPVLDVRPDMSTDPTASFSRLMQRVDYGTSIPVVYDLPGMAFRAQQNTWKLWGRDQHAWFRSLLYTLQGQRVPIWIPSFMSDLKASLAISGSSLQVEWAGYTQFGLGKPNRRDLRIELLDGTVFYRRVLGAIEGPRTETLTLDSALGVGAIDPSWIREINVLALSVLASDSIDIEHATGVDGIASATTGWVGVAPDV